ncbi:MAG: hypothetical protein ACI4S4_03710 [Candidatus Ornithospirochaeta sp.]
MTEFDKLCQEAEDIDWETRVAIIRGKSDEILPLLNEARAGESSGADIFATFLLGALAADGKLTEEEYALLFPLLQSFLGDSINYSDARKAVKGMKKESRELKELGTRMIEVIGEFSPDLRKDIVMVIMLICAVDGKISFSEKNWIRSLLF